MWRPRHATRTPHPKAPGNPWTTFRSSFFLHARSNHEQPQRRGYPNCLSHIFRLAHTHHIAGRWAGILAPFSVSHGNSRCAKLVHHNIRRQSDATAKLRCMVQLGGRLRDTVPAALLCVCRIRPPPSRTCQWSGWIPLCMSHLWQPHGNDVGSDIGYNRCRSRNKLGTKGIAVRLLSALPCIPSLVGIYCCSK